MEKIKMNPLEFCKIKAFLECAYKCMECGCSEEAMDEIQNAIDYIEDYHSEFY